MNANIAYAVTKQIETKKNVAYVPTRHWIETKRMQQGYNISNNFVIVTIDKIVQLFSL